MGRISGKFDTTEDNERADLNKCPDCGCYFGGDNCPLCGKECPEEMRAGNRKPTPRPKRKKSGGSDRVTFIPWYYEWWFIIVMLFISRFIGIILLAGSPHKRSVKLTVIGIIIALMLVAYVGIPLYTMLSLRNAPGPVNTELTHEEYVAACETIDPEAYYRAAAEYEGKFVSMTLTVEKMLSDYAYHDYAGGYATYYICRDPEGGDFEIIIRDCLREGAVNFIAGDVITLYGEGAKSITVNDLDGNLHAAPSVHMAFAQRVEP